MSILVCGVNHKTAPIILREKIVFAQEKLPLYLNDLASQENILEAVLLSTCNRSELYCESEGPHQVIDWFCRQHPVPRPELESLLYLYQGQAAVEHIMRVACGLDSMVLGESQILGQMKGAFSESCAAGAVGVIFNRLFQQVFAVVKEVRSSTAIGACPVSVSSAAVNFIKANVPLPLQQANVLLVGAGLSIDLVLRHLKTAPPQRAQIANRSFQNASLLAEKYGADVISLDQLPHALQTADIIIAATGGPLPVVTRDMFTARTRPLWIIDLAVPRDVEATVAEFDYVRLYSIDDLKESIQHNLSNREHAAQKASEVIQQKSQELMAWLGSFQMVATTIRAYRKQIEDICRLELAKANQQLGRGDDPVKVLASFAHGFTNKLLHAPSIQLRQAGHEGRREMLEWAQSLFTVPDGV